MELWLKYLSFTSIYKGAQIDSQSTGESSATRGRLGGLVRFAPDRFQFHPTAKILEPNDLLMIPL